MSGSPCVIVSEGLPGDLRPLCYGRSTWDLPFQGSNLLTAALAWMQKAGYGEVYLLDDTPELWLHALTRKLPRTARYCQKVDARPQSRQNGEGLQLPRGTGHVLLLKPCAMLEPDVESLERFHHESGAAATFSLVRLDPGTLQWPYIPACRMDVNGRILEVEKLRRTDALGSTRLDNVIGTSAPTRPREFWAPRNVAIMDPQLADSLPLQELVAPLAGLARSLAEQKVACYGRSMRGRWWSTSTPGQVLKANSEALAPPPPDASDATIRQMVSRIRTRPGPQPSTRPRGLIASAAAAVERKAENPGVHSSAVVEVTASLGQGVTVGAGSKILGYTSIGPACMLADMVSVTRSVLGDRCEIDSRVTLENSLLASETVLPPEIVLKHAVVGAGEIQNLLRGVPPGGSFLDSVQAVDDAVVAAYWAESAPVPQRTPGRASLRMLSQNLENEVYQLSDGARHFVLKRRLDRSARPLTREYHVLRALEPLNVSPSPYGLDLRPEMAVAPCLVMSFVEGERIHHGGIDVDLATRLGKLFATIHQMPVDTLLRDLPELGGWGYRDLLTYVVEVLGEYKAFLEFRNHEGLEDDELTAYITSLLEWATSMAESANHHWQAEIPQRLCHGDLREFNMALVEGGHVRLLDWEKCGIGDAAYDMGWFLALSGLSREAEAALEAAYGAGSDPAFWDRARTYRIIDLIAWPVHLMQTVQRCRHQATRMTARAPRIAREYEEDAYEALSVALNSFAALSGGEAAYTPESIREMGTLFAPQ